MLYHGWQGELQSPGWGCLALVRVGLVQVFRRKLYWFVLGLCFLQFAFFLMSIYAITQNRLRARRSSKSWSISVSARRRSAAVKADTPSSSSNKA